MIRNTEAIAPKISALWYPKLKASVAFFLARSTAVIENPKPSKSLSRWAASDRIA